MKKKIFSAAVALAAVALTANAQSYIMQIHKVDGTVTEIDADDVDRVTFAEKPFEVATVPGGTDLAAWFAENADVFAANPQVGIPLEAGGQYTMSGDVDFAATQVRLYTTDAANPATVTMTADAGFCTSAGLTVDGINFDCSASQSPFISLSETPDEDIMGVISGDQNYYDIQQPLQVLNCEVEGVNGYFIYDNNVKYCVGTAVVRNCVVQLTGTEASAVIRFQGGFINDLTVENSTFWGAAGADAKYFVQYNNSGRCDRGGYESNSITYANCTFYNVAKTGQWGNYNGFAGRNTSYWNMTGCIFVDCGNNQIPRRFLGGRQNCSNRNFADNTYMFDGAFESVDGSVAGYDDSGTAIEADPLFIDPANGNFTLSGSEQFDKRTGDPRWITYAE